jgi:hypothetical protein
MEDIVSVVVTVVRDTDRRRVNVFTPRERAHSGQIYGSQRKKRNRVLRRRELELESLERCLSVNDLIAIKAKEVGVIIATEKNRQIAIVKGLKRRS